MAEDVLINCDMGESFGSWKMGNDQQIMPYIDAANIACGGHAGDPMVMATTVELALSHQVKIGAHPGYPDLQGFGRRAMKLTVAEIQQLIWSQTGALYGITKALGGELFHIKPHGALYNDMMRDESILRNIMQAVRQFDSELKLVIQATPNWQRHRQLANEVGVELLLEAFSDRGYQTDGLLVPRNQQSALLTKDESISQSENILYNNQVKSIAGDVITLEINTLCIHGDGDEALEIARALAG